MISIFIKSIIILIYASYNSRKIVVNLIQYETFLIMIIRLSVKIITDRL